MAETLTPLAKLGEVLKSPLPVRGLPIRVATYTTADPAWQALLSVPGHPEYPSQHGCFTAGFSDALAAALHTKHVDVTMPGGANGSSVLTTTQHFDNVEDIQKQVVDARVRLGFHFRNSVEQGVKIGNDVADWELKRYFQPVHS